MSGFQLDKTIKITQDIYFIDLKIKPEVLYFYISVCIKMTHLKNQLYFIFLIYDFFLPYKT